VIRYLKIKTKQHKILKKLIHKTFATKNTKKNTVTLQYKQNKKVLYLQYEPNLDKRKKRKTDGNINKILY